VSPAVSLRPARPADTAALGRLAGRDSAAIPRGRLLVADAGGELVAALSLDTGAAIADPFAPTAHLVAALRAHAGALPSESSTRWKPTRSPDPQPATC
jgi:hypothetical protein